MIKTKLYGKIGCEILSKPLFTCMFTFKLHFYVRCLELVFFPFGLHHLWIICYQGLTVLS